MDFKETIKNLPHRPGVYVFKNAQGKVLYVGKAKDLKRRVSSYFRSGTPLAPRLLSLVAHLGEVSFLTTATDAEALIYENNLIKQYQPRYNVALRDDKTYPLLKLTVNEKFPRLVITRKKMNDGAVYYGPFTSAKVLKEAVSILRKLFPLRTCARLKKSVCLDYHIGQCLGPCEGKTNKKRYADTVTQLRLFLGGRKSELIRRLSGAMAAASKRQDFEEAASLRDKITVLSAMREQRVISTPLSELQELKDLLSISGRLETIEAFDVSNIMGQEACGSMVQFHKGRPKKKAYKRFRIKMVSGIDDYKMMRELIHRRYDRALKEKKKLPDLILIDGGRGHLAAAAEELSLLGLRKIPIVSLAKALEKIYTMNRQAPIILPSDSKTLHLLQRIRNEAHRFAVAYHRKLMKKRITRSALDGIEGVGKKRKRNLLERFGSVENIKKAVREDLMRVKGMNEKVSKGVIRHFRKR